MTLRFMVFTFFVFQFLGSSNEFDAHSRANILAILGKKIDSREFKDYKQFWDIDKNFENKNQGLKLYVNSLREEVETIFLAGENCRISNSNFEKFTSAIPFGISWSDNISILAQKLGEGHKLIGKNTMKFYRGNITIEVAFVDWASEKITSLKFSVETNRIIESPSTEIKKESSVAIKMREGLKEFEPKPIVVIQPLRMDTAGITSSFKQAILEVFRSYNESNFYSIKGKMLAKNNFWNYHFTYATKIKIPGEKFNMLYSFPFLNSPLDFVSVIKESDTYDGTIETAHRNFEKKLISSFSEKEGWVATCIPNKGSNKLPDVEFRNDKYGAIILDYSKNPNGKHVVYLRFLLFSS
jgi:hypothetical protein